MLLELKLHFFPHNSTRFHTSGWGVDFILAEEEVTDVSDLLIVYDWGTWVWLTQAFQPMSLMDIPSSCTADCMCLNFTFYSSPI